MYSVFLVEQHNLVILKLIITPVISVLFETHEVLLCKKKIGFLNIFMLVTDSYKSLDT